MEAGMESPMEAGMESPDEGGAAQRARTTKRHRKTLFETSSGGLRRPLTMCGRAQKAF